MTATLEDVILAGPRPLEAKAVETGILSCNSLGAVRISNASNGIFVFLKETGLFYP